MRRPRVNPNGDVYQVFYLTDDLLHDCFLIANMSRAQNAQMIYGTMSHEVNDKHHILLVYKARDYIYGFVKGCINSDNKAGANIDWLFVDPGYQRFGIGGKLVAAYENVCAMQNVKQVEVLRVPTLQAKTFYAKLGYKSYGDTIKCYKNLGR